MAKLSFRRSVAAVAVAFVGAALSLPASAHSDIHASQPPDGAVLDTSPAAIVLSFMGPVQVMSLRLLDDAGRERPIQREGERSTAVREMRAAVPNRLPAGDYRVEWRGVSPDGHAGGSVVRFRVAPAR